MSSESNKTELVSIRLTPGQKETWDSRSDAACKVRDLLDDLDEDENKTDIAKFVEELSSMEERWSVRGLHGRTQDAEAVRAARDAGLDVPGDAERACNELYAAVKSSEIPTSDTFEVSESLVSSFRSVWNQ